jgi:hypothetical protein
MHWTDQASLGTMHVDAFRAWDRPMSSRDSHDHRLDSLVLDLIEWLLHEPRPYAEVMDAWRTTCARLPIWEEAVDRGFLVSEMVARGRVLVRVTPAGRAFLQGRRGGDVQGDGHVASAG